MSKFNPALATKRRQKDIMKLMMSDYKVQQSKENPADFIVLFKGPKETPYEGGAWYVHVLLPDQYPYKSPSIGFSNKIYHPNIDEGSGSVCLDVINQSWSPMYDLKNVFDTFLPQLLSYPNPTDPMNSEAASLYLKDIENYNIKVKNYVEKYAKIQQTQEEQNEQQKMNNSSQNKQQQQQQSQQQQQQEEENQSQVKQPRKYSNEKSQSNGSTNDEMEDNVDDFDEEDEKISNISMDNVSELSDCSNDLKEAMEY